MARALKVFVMPIGFHDAYVAASSRKAALEAWGSDADLFARGIAQEVTDLTLAAEALASPGKVIKRLRGTAEEQVAALPPDAPPRPAKGGRTVAAPRTSRPAKVSADATPARPTPRPPRDALDTAEDMLAQAEKRHRAADKALAEKQAALDRERRDTARAQAAERESLAGAVDAEKDKYDRAIKRWRG